MGSIGNVVGMQGAQPLAPHQVFADPRHEQLGRELLEFNDDLMSQSEAMSDNEEGTPMLPSLGTNTGQLSITGGTCVVPYAHNYVGP